MRRLTLMLVFVLLIGSVAVAEPGKSLVRLSRLSDKEMKAFLGGEYDLAATGRDFVEVVLTPGEVAALQKAGMKTAVLIPDLDAHIAAVLAGETPTQSYYTFDTMTAQLKAWAGQYPEIARLESVGKTWEGRDIWAMKVSDHPELDEPEAACLINGAHHAREWTTVEVTMAALKQYLEGYGSDERLTRLVNEREVWFVPMVNPDGHVYSRTQSKYWRKNRRPDDSGYGVDLNRNYGYKWGMTGSSGSPSSDTFHGPTPFSEPETLAMKALSEREQFQATLSLHSYSELILYPFAYAYNAPNPEEPIYKEWGAKMAAFNGYTVQNCTDLYPAMGISDDWFYGQMKALAFTIEMGRTFIPPVAEIPVQCGKNVPAVFLLIEETPAYAITSPSGNPALVAQLDATDTLRAVRTLTGLLPAFAGSTREEGCRRLGLVAGHLADLVIASARSGHLELWEAVKADPACKAIFPVLRSKVGFDLVHEGALPPALVADLGLDH